MLLTPIQLLSVSLPQGVLWIISAFEVFVFCVGLLRHISSECIYLFICLKIFIYLFWLCRSLLRHAGSSSWRVGFLVAACRLLVVTCVQNLFPWPGMEPGPAALGARSLTHATTREVPLQWVHLESHRFGGYSFPTLSPFAWPTFRVADLVGVEVGPRNLHFWPVPGWYCCCWSGDATWRTIVL